MKYSCFVPVYDRELVEDLDEDTSGWFGRLMHSLAQVKKNAVENGKCFRNLYIRFLFL